MEQSDPNKGAPDQNKGTSDGYQPQNSILNEKQRKEREEDDQHNEETARCIALQHQEQLEKLILEGKNEGAPLIIVAKEVKDAFESFKVDDQLQMTYFYKEENVEKSTTIWEMLTKRQTMQLIQFAKVRQDYELIITYLHKALLISKQRRSTLLLFTKELISKEQGQIKEGITFEDYDAEIQYLQTILDEIIVAQMRNSFEQENKSLRNLEEHKEQEEHKTE
eukprot:403338623